MTLTASVSSSGTAKPTEHTTTSGLFQKFIQSGLYLRSWSLRTAKTYGQALTSYQRFQQSLQDSPASGETERLDRAQGPLTKAQLETWIIWLRQQGLTPGGANVYIRTFNSFLSWLHEEGHTDKRIKLKLLPDPKKPIKIFTDEQVKTICRYKPVNFFDFRIHTIFLTLIDTGVRIEEGLTLKIDKINFDTLMLLVVGKGRKERWVPFSEQLRKHLYKLLQVIKKKGIRTEYIFCSRTGKRVSYFNAYRDIGKLCTQLGIVGEFVHPHSTRHYFACSYIRNGGDIFRLSKILGHASVQTTMIYLRGLGLEVLENQRPELNPLARIR